MLPAPDDDATRTVGEAKCDPQAGEITVCGDGDMSRFRAGPADDARWAEKPIRAAVKLPGGARGVVYAEQRSLPGASAPAAMVRVTIPLGARAKKKK